MPTQAKQQNQSISGFEPYVQKAGEEYMGEPMRTHFTKVLNQVEKRADGRCRQDRGPHEGRSGQLS